MFSIGIVLLKHKNYKTAIKTWTYNNICKHLPYCAQNTGVFLHIKAFRHTELAKFEWRPNLTQHHKDFHFLMSQFLMLVGSDNRGKWYRHFIDILGHAQLAWSSGIDSKPAKEIIYLTWFRKTEGFFCWSWGINK